MISIDGIIIFLLVFFIGPMLVSGESSEGTIAIKNNGSIIDAYNNTWEIQGAHIYINGSKVIPHEPADRLLYWNHTVYRLVVSAWEMWDGNTWQNTTAPTLITTTTTTTITSATTTTSITTTTSVTTTIPASTRISNTTTTSDTTTDTMTFITTTVTTTSVIVVTTTTISTTTITTSSMMTMMTTTNTDITTIDMSQPSITSEMTGTENILQTTALALSNPWFFPSSSCLGQSGINPSCNMSFTVCAMLTPCQNNGTCVYNGSSSSSFTCWCPPDITGVFCENDHRLCQPGACSYRGMCNETSNETFTCACQSGWTNSRCQSKINYCENTQCLNNGVCQSLVVDYTCQCLGNSFSGRHCETVETSITIKKIISKSFAYIAILFISAVFIFVLILDILKYICGVDLAKSPFDDDQKEKSPRRSKKPRQAVRFVYIN